MDPRPREFGQCCFTGSLCLALYQSDYYIPHSDVKQEPTNATNHFVGGILLLYIERLHSIKELVRITKISHTYLDSPYIYIWNNDILHRHGHKYPV
mmetsp:Transcript_15093/g.17361  ORF Transcript_15093/g.17361 Transcript_15093/m.17361 type:complete len:96 (-) Transcript_15093:562-849(-)